MDNHSSEEEKKTTVHNFSVPSNDRWGNRRPLEATKVSRGDIPSSTLHGRHFPTDSDPPGDQPISDIRPPAVKRIPFRIKLKIKNNSNNKKSSEDQSESKVELIIPEKKEEENKEKEPERVNNWRPRRACATESYKGGTLCLSHLLSSGGRTTRESADDTISGGGSSNSSHKQPVSLEISLTKDEIEQDFLLMTGKKPPKRPKRRPKHVHQNLKALYPSLRRNWSCEN